ncbi:Mth938-like domain-containing protein [Neisseria montereyensis]|uniref:MTH938/NDUFAF3 family protein n=1 Tax=Neisseria montereyensis TaxID=2973938 RepID=A0ABT2F9N2_9NEIS|nr:MTH938/NDUFAF3 family protein [Neisseria montereyensis]MCS4532903.1 MTH938/NDUFAF3 family protein [Neisseria montereyensis]
MLIEETQPGGQNEINGYAPGQIEINSRAYTEAVVLKDTGIEKPTQTEPAALSAQDFIEAVSEGVPPEVILVGTGEKQVFLHPKIAVALAAKGIGLECMSTAAACRTFMILQSEGRRVWAWLWP